MKSLLADCVRKEAADRTPKVVFGAKAFAEATQANKTRTCIIFIVDIRAVVESSGSCEETDNKRRKL